MDRAGRIGVAIDGTSIVFDEAPQARDGRVYVPLRGLFERLGASVAFEAGHIAASAGTHAIRLSIGATTATVDGVAQELDAPPLVVRGRTLVPLRFVSQALGAHVTYDATRRTVDVSPAPAPLASVARTAAPPLTVAPSPSTPARRRATVALRPGEAPIALRLLRAEPAAGATVARRRLEISTTFAEPVAPQSVRVSLDGEDVTALAHVGARNVVIEPADDLVPGPHEISFAGRTPDREAFVAHWTFSTRDADDANFLSGLEPVSGIALARTSFVVSGYTRPGARVRVAATSSGSVVTFVNPGDDSASIDAVSDARGYFEAPVALADRGSGIVDVRVSSTTSTGAAAIRTLRLRR
ncbi:MAG: hypothetical protein NVS1B2_14070 [Vulcanimicrobiaceae bacterium]